MLHHSGFTVVLVKFEISKNFTIFFDKKGVNVLNNLVKH